MTRSVPFGMVPTLAAMRARRRRLVRLRTTAPPTALETTKPTRGGCPARVSVCPAWTTISVEPTRAPLGPLSAAVKSELVRSRCPAGSTGTASGGELGAALGAAGRQDGATRTGAHPEAEAVGLGPATVVRLESTLAHEVLRYWSGPVGLLSAGGRQDGRNRKPAPPPAPGGSSDGVSRACENGRQACSKVRERQPQGQTSLGPGGIRDEPPRSSTAGRTPPCGHAARLTDFVWDRQNFRRAACSAGLDLVSVRPRPTAIPTGCGYLCGRGTMTLRQGSDRGHRRKGCGISE